MDSGGRSKGDGCSSSSGVASGRRGSVLAEQALASGARPAAAARFPTNEEVVKAVQERVEVRVRALCAAGQPWQCGEDLCCRSPHAHATCWRRFHMHLVQKTVDLCRNYRHAVLYMVFVATYMLVLYFQVRIRCCSMLRVTAAAAAAVALARQPLTVAAARPATWPMTAGQHVSR
jgi:hypothetical protein